jgi:hypothetical protein
VHHAASAHNHWSGLHLRPARPEAAVPCPPYPRTRSHRDWSSRFATAQDTPRLLTNRPAGRELLKLPKEEDAFGFVVFGDRTGGPPEGIEVLKQAVADTNLLDPDLVLTVGDLVNGYNAQEAWKAQAAEYKAAMSKLRMPWFPVAGNHDIYWRGPNKPASEHERDFETTFGPLWYAVQHKKCWFVVLYSDEGNPVTGEKDFNKPECQHMSEAQFTWLGETLQKAKDARHVFVFLHHPRWLAKYGTDWDRVHELLLRTATSRPCSRDTSTACATTARRTASSTTRWPRSARSSSSKHRRPAICTSTTS